MEQNEPIVAPQDNNNKQNSEKGLKAATIIASIVALCGVGFGVYEFLQNTQKDAKISDLSAKIKESENMEATQKNEPTSESTDTTVVDSTAIDSTVEFSNPVIISSNVGDGNSEIRYRLDIKGLFSGFADTADTHKYWRLLSSEGNLTCSIEIRDDNGTAEEDCDLSAHSGKVSDISYSRIGNGGIPYMIVLTDSGEIEYLSIDSDGRYNVLKKLSLPKKVSKVYSDVYMLGHGGRIGGGYSVLFVFDDGTIADFYSFIK